MVCIEFVLVHDSCFLLLNPFICSAFYLDTFMHNILLLGYIILTVISLFNP